MSGEDAPTKTISDFEATLSKADTAVATFEKDDKTLVHVLRAQLRKNPTLIPALVLLISILAFSIVAPRFFGMGALLVDSPPEIHRHWTASPRRPQSHGPGTDIAGGEL